MRSRSGPAGWPSTRSLLIAEHGDYPYNEKLQKLYPRGRFFREVLDVFRASGRSVPVFIDKHLSYSRAEARQMVDQAKGHACPADGRLELAGHVAAARAGDSAGPDVQGRRWWRRAVTSKSSGSIPWRRSNAWSSDASAAASRRGSPP